MKLQTFILLFIFATLLLTENIYAIPGDFDTTFGINGQTIGTMPGTGPATSVAMQTDGKIVLASSSFGADSTSDFAVLRLNTNGTTDTAFGTNGRTDIVFDNLSNENAMAIAVQTDGKILIAGDVEFGSPGWDFGVARLNSNGTLDSTFGTGGKVKIPVSNSNDFTSDLALQADGKIVIVGKGYNQPNSDTAFVRLNTNGTLDTTFNGTGKLVTGIGSNDFLSAVMIQPDGKIVASGSDGNDFAVLRLNSNGSFDTTFNGNGIVTTPIGTQRDEAFTVALQADGKIIIGGSANSGSGNLAALVRYNSNGSLDSSFGSGGKVSLDVDSNPGTTQNFLSISVQTDGKIIGITNGGFIIVRCNTNGLLDSTFGTNGVKIISTNGSTSLNKAVIQNDGKYVVGGYAGSGFTAARILTSNTIYAKAFDFDGDAKTDISIYRPTVGQWWYLRSSDNANRVFSFGTSTDKIVPADYTGDGKTDIATFTPSTGFWSILRSEDSTYYAFPFGSTGDIAVPADYDADGKADSAVFRSSTQTWYISKSSGGTTITPFGTTGDVPAVGDYDGDGKTDIGIYRVALGQWWYLRSSDSTNRVFTFGTSTDKIVQGDYTGDGKTDIAFFRPSTGFWYILRSEDSSFYAFPFGTSGDIPVSGDYDGDGKFDAAVFRPSGNNWYISGSTAGTIIQTFGTTGDQPVANAFVP